MCYRPIKISKPRRDDTVYESGFRHTAYGSPSEPYPDHADRIVPCGKCLECVASRSKMWSLRIVHEMQEYDSNLFATLTYDDEHLPSDGSLSKHHHQTFIKLLRYHLGERFPFRYFLAGEYGETFGRPHYHVIFFGLPEDPAVIEAIQECWPHGDVRKIVQANIATARYLAGYVTKKIIGGGSDRVRELGLQPEYHCQSLGIGRRFCDSQLQYITNNDVYHLGDVPVSIPRYYYTRLGFSPEFLRDRSEKQAVEQIERILERSTDVVHPNSALSLNCDLKYEIEVYLAGWRDKIHRESPRDVLFQLTVELGILKQRAINALARQSTLKPRLDPGMEYVK